MGTRMLRTRIIRGLGGAFALAAIVGAGTALAASQSVAIAGLAFGPSAVTVLVRETVTWTNSDAQTHTATADDGSWNAGNIAGSGGTGAVVFTTAGTFPYHCTIHPQMTGTITVKAAAATASVAGSTMAASDTAPIFQTDGGTGGSMLPPLMIAALAVSVGLAVMLRRPTSSLAVPFTVHPVLVGDVTTPLPAAIAPAGGTVGSADRSLAPIAIVAVMGAVAVAIVWRRANWSSVRRRNK